MTPFVSCIMPTRNRAAFLPAAIDCFLKQDYPNKELIILGDNDEAHGIELCSAWPVRYVIDKRMDIGPKRNRCCELSQGEIICHFDSDDWSAPNRISAQVELMAKTGKSVAGSSAIYFWDTIQQKAKRYRAGITGKVCGTTLCYRKDFWEIHKFQDKKLGEDNAFVDPIINQIADSKDESMFVARIHGDHTSSKAHMNNVVDTNLIPSAFWQNEELRLDAL
jgi:glycosyltransferase involved in cell wall biosynthesis